MFDTVIIEGLKLKAPKEITNYLKKHNAEFPNHFQTKDLENFLSTYLINENCQIFEEIRKPTGKKVPYKFPIWSWKDNRSFLERLYWSIKHKKYSLKEEDKLVDEYKTVKQKSKLTNTFNIYSYDEIGGRYVELEYQIKAVDGKVKSAKLIKSSIESEQSSLDRKQRDIEFKAKMDQEIIQRKELHSQWYYPIIKEIYNPFVFFLRLAVQKICNKIVTWSYRWTGI